MKGEWHSKTLTARCDTANCIIGLVKGMAENESTPAEGDTISPDVVTVDDVRDGVVFMDEHGSTYQVAGAGEFMYVYGTRPTDSFGTDIERDPSDRLCLPRMLVAAMLNAAESIEWPKGHRLAKKEEPDLLAELLQAYEEIHSAMAKSVGGYPLTTPLIRKVKAALSQPESEGGEG